MQPNTPLKINIEHNPVKFWKMLCWLVISTHLKNISQIGSFPQIGVKIKKYLKPPPSLC